MDNYAKRLLEKDLKSMRLEREMIVERNQELESQLAKNNKRLGEIDASIKSMEDAIELLD